MRFVRFLIFILLINTLLFFAVALNFHFALENPSKFKTILKESDAYNIASAAIRENIVEENPNLDTGNLLEALNEKIGSNGFQIMAEDLVDQLYLRENGSHKEVVLKYSLLQGKIGSEVQLPPDKTYSFNNHIFTLANLNKILFVLAALLVLAFYLHVWLIGSTLKQKLKWLGYSLLIAGFSLLAICSVLFIFVPELSNAVIHISQIDNQKIANAFIKVIAGMVDVQKKYYVLELILTFAISATLFVLAKITKEDGPTIIPNSPIGGNLK